jgi:hypothetical protein
LSDGIHAAPASILIVMICSFSIPSQGSGRAHPVAASLPDLHSAIDSG